MKGLSHPVAWMHEDSSTDAAGGSGVGAHRENCGSTREPAAALDTSVGLEGGH